MCTCLRRLQYCTDEYSPEGNRCRKSSVIRTILFFYKEPLSRKCNNVQVPTIPTIDRKSPICVASNMGTWALVASVYTYLLNQKIESALAITYVESRAAAYQYCTVQHNPALTLSWFSPGCQVSRVYILNIYY